MYTTGEFRIVKQPSIEGVRMDDIANRIRQLQTKIASLEILRSELGDDLVDRKIAELKAQILSLRAEGAVVSGDVHLEDGEFVGRDQVVQGGDQSVVVRGDVADSTIIHARTVVLSNRLWGNLQVNLPQADLQRATTAYLNYLLDRHYYLNLKGMGISDRVPLRLRLLDLYVPLRARLELPEGETWKRDLRLAGR
ncbi:MAG: hypothetical protein D6770_08960, partial [Anaerolineae bacterium]